MVGIKRAFGLAISMLALSFVLSPVAWAEDPDRDFAIKNRQVVTPPQNENPNMTHWLFVECDTWSGCYMPCRGTLKACMEIGHDAKWTVLSIHSRIESNHFEANSLQGPVPLPSPPK